MVTNKASMKRNGVQDFVSLRATAVLITAYVIFMGWFFLTTENITYSVWQELFSSIAMKTFTLLTLVAIMTHTRIGLWQVLTDYVKAPLLRAVMQYVLNIIAFAYVVVGLIVLWGV
ncbi:succinate dehydrogenase, hydrophobic membrane anchor protein [Alteromonas ponticola]|uniref:Succinate dehydrogenase hydrophobic membrane anchor subunit n=1 Tax=Alteromonas aquimaris TaxID=2998417 RepID=A0ABT3P736_9ALTE|nr:succinate dehydrogenase, hydrophobic membrane anchor protein [Alteromonas aquimaris]MCW8108560.1 succinate dehydrogenase, hydrophobic membrane anchor protein [Alteromonas aquimaris]